MENNIDANPPFISVIIPVYNKEKTVSISIQSVLDQTYKNFELIIVCDPSSDNSRQIVEKYSSKSIVRIFDREKKGAGGYAARNLGINHAKGEWIAFLDADDTWKNFHLESITQMILKFPDYSIVSTTYASVLENDIKPSKFHLSHKDLKSPYIHIDFESYAHLLCKKMSPFNTNTIALKKDLIIQSGLFPGQACKRGGDTTLWIKSLFLCRKAICSTQISSLYNIEESHVIKFTPPKVFSNCMRLQCMSIIKSIKTTSKDKAILKKISDFKMLESLKAAYNSKSLKIRHLNYLYSPRKKIFFFILFILQEVLGKVCNINK